MKLKDQATIDVALAVSDVLEGKKPKVIVAPDVEEPKVHKEEEVKYPHDMYKGDDVKTAKDAKEHEALADDGYTHEKPAKEAAEPKAKGEKEFKAKHKIKKSGEKEDGSVVKEDAIEEAAKVDPKAMAADIPQMKLSTFLKKASRKPKVYFDGVDLVDGDKDVVSGALDPKKKITVQKLIDALTEDTIEEGFSKAEIKKAVETALKMDGNMTGATKKIEKMKKGLSKDKEVAAALQLANESVDVDDSVLEEAHEMNEASDKEAKYKAFFDKALKKFGVKSPAELKGDKKKEFFDYVDAGYEADNEAD